MTREELIQTFGDPGLNRVIQLLIEARMEFEQSMAGPGINTTSSLPSEGNRANPGEAAKQGEI